MYLQQQQERITKIKTNNKEYEQRPNIVVFCKECNKANYNKTVIIWYEWLIYRGNDVLSVNDIDHADALLTTAFMINRIHSQKKFGLFSIVNFFMFFCVDYVIYYLGFYGVFYVFCVDYVIYSSLMYDFSWSVPSFVVKFRRESKILCFNDWCFRHQQSGFTKLNKKIGTLKRLKIWQKKWHNQHKKNTKNSYS